MTRVWPGTKVCSPEGIKSTVQSTTIAVPGGRYWALGVTTTSSPYGYADAGEARSAKSNAIGREQDHAAMELFIRINVPILTKIF